MKASAFEAQPKAKSSSGTPPTAPCSITQVTAPCRPSSSRMRGTLAEMPKPRLTQLPPCSSCATRRAIDLLDVEFRHAERIERPEDFAGDRRIVERLRRLLLVGIDDDVIDQHARHAHVMRLQRAFLGDALDLRDDDAAIVAGGQRLIETAEIGALVLIGQVAALVGGRRADDRHLRHDRLEITASPRPRIRSS